MKSHVLQETRRSAHDHRRHGARRVEARHDRTPLQLGAKQGRRRHQALGHRPAAPLLLPATGLLIPGINAKVPRIYESEATYAPGYLSQLVAIGALTPGDEAESLDELIDKGIMAMTPKSILSYEDQFGDGMTCVIVGYRGIEFIVRQDCHGWRMRLKPIIRALPHDEAAAFIHVLDKSCVQGPRFWDRIVGYGRDEDDSEKSASDWLGALFEKHPALNGKPKDTAGQTLMQVLLREPKKSVRQRTTELRRLVADFVEKSAAATRYMENGALACTTWDQNCLINHAHDYIHEGIHTEGWDNNDHDAFAASCETIEELQTAMQIIGGFIHATTQLEEWTNAHC